MHYSDAISAFCNYLQFEKRYTIHTLTAYRNDLRVFFEFAALQFGVSLIHEIQPVQVRTWLASLRDEGISARSLNRKLSALKSFFKYHLRQSHITQSPLATLNGPKTGKKLPVWFEPEQVSALLQPDMYEEGWEGKTARLAIAILYEAGLRRGELASLRVSQVDFHHGSIRVLGKGRKERILPMRAGLLSEIKEYVQEAQAMGIGQSGDALLLVREKGKPVNEAWIYRTVKRYAGLVSTRTQRSPHVLRHSFATHLTNAGADLNAVKELLGHSSLAATQVYTHNSIEKLKNVHGKAHPKG